MKGKLYGVGVGPGDKKMLTLKAVEVLKEADIILVPDTGGENVALKIVEDYIEGKEKLLIEIPMTKDKEILERSYQNGSEKIMSLLDQGINLAFITIGDPTIYSTFIYFQRIIMAKGYETEIINGIPSFCAVAARLNISLADRNEILTIAPASYEDFDDLLDSRENLVLMKSGRKIMDVIKRIDEKGLLENAKMVENCNMDNEIIYENLRDVENPGYFNIIVLNRKS
ncbi:MAG: precorrin-2 C(20)-methyltransferase [Tissierellia bacterium]|nr:precorrin-2 C(20)-methyltransferase [Tissierellia bacterium]